MKKQALFDVVLLLTLTGSVIGCNKGKDEKLGVILND